MKLQIAMNKINEYHIFTDEGQNYSISGHPLVEAAPKVLK